MLKHLRMKFEREVKSERRKNCYGQACSSLEFPCVKKNKCRYSTLHVCAIMVYKLSENMQFGSFMKSK